MYGQSCTVYEYVSGNCTNRLNAPVVHSRYGMNVASYSKRPNTSLEDQNKNGLQKRAII